MQPQRTPIALAVFVGTTLAASAGFAQAVTGARAFLQAWNPVEPDQANVIPLFDEPTLVSDSLQGAWSRARPRICEQLRLKMGVGGAAHGETLSDITCLLDEAVVLDVTSAGQNALHATFAVSGYVEATSTTPDVAFGVGLGEYADPRFSVALTAKLDLVLAVQPDRGKTLRVSKAQFTLNDATLDSHNFSGDMLKFVAGELVPFFGGPDYKSMAENAVNAVGVDFVQDFDAGLAPVNAQLKGPSDVVRVGLSGSGHYISVAFAPREFTPLTNGRMTGMIRWDAAQFTPRDGCKSFDIRATVQTGPLPMYTPNASAPVREVGTLQISPVDAGSCAFTMSGLAAGWPNILTARLVGPYVAKSAGNALYRVSFGMRGDGWNGRLVVPAPLAEARNYLVARNVDATATEALGSAAAKKTYRTDPRINPEQFNTLQVDPAAGKTTGPRASDHVSQQVEAVSLNPQPLPPDPDPTVQAYQTRKDSAVKRLKSTASQPVVEGQVVVP
ncbi:MAG: hypothetical protein ABJA62_03060 [Luteimonas sp.]